MKKQNRFSELQWQLRPQEIDRMTKAETALEIPSTLRAFALIAVGYPAESRPQQMRFDESRIHYVD